VHGWSEQEYFLWVQKHEHEEEQLALLEKAVNDQLVGEADKGEEAYVKLIREVLEHARQHQEVSPGVQ
jgi:hypothetical protein